MQRAELISVKLTDVADIVRCDGKTLYPKGTVYLYASATDKQVHFLEEQDEVLPDRCIVIIPKDKCHPIYLFQVLDYFAPAFMHRYVGNAINLPVERLKHFKLKWQSDYAEQERIGKRLQPMREAILEKKKTLEQLEKFKKCLFDVFFPQIDEMFKKGNNQAKA